MKTKLTRLLARLRPQKWMPRGLCEPTRQESAFIRPQPGDGSRRELPVREFASYWTDEKIIEQLCKERFKIAKSRHEHSRIARLAGSPVPIELNSIDQMLPPRADWNKYRPKFRSEIPQPGLKSLKRATLSLRQTTPQPQWAVRLQEFTNRIRERALNENNFSFSQPEVKWEEKGKPNEYRALSRFELEDNLIIKLVAAYLRDLLDVGFEKSSYAFRTRPPKGEMPTHHTAFNEICNFRTSHRGHLFVAECDIRGFYDSVDHDVALAALNRVAATVHSTDPTRSLHPRARELFQAYLQCYSFPENVLRQAVRRLRSSTRNQEAHFPWPEEALRYYHAAPTDTRIGLPQGGALSCVIANLVLDLADKRVRAATGDAPECLYLRYCDDMVLISTHRADCRDAFEAYLSALAELKLPYHPPQSVTIYGKTFWSDKSKEPYCWTGQTGPGCVPWVGFVGYQVRYDGLTRIRPGSIQRNVQRLRDATDIMKFGLRAINTPNPGDDVGEPVRATKQQAVASLRQSLTAKGVGRIKRRHVGSGPRWLCAADGYRALNGKPFVPIGLKRLDRERARQIKRFENANIQYGSGIRRDGRRGAGPKHYWTSYIAQFKNAGGVALIKRPRRSWKQQAQHTLAVIRRGIRGCLRFMGYRAFAKSLWPHKQPQPTVPGEVV